MEQTWKPISKYEKSYHISNIGEVKSLKRKTERGVYREELIMAKSKNHSGYFTVALCNNVSIKGCLVHRLVAQTFIPNPENKPTVNHKNGIKTDNRVENLEWATYSEQNIHRYRVLKTDKPKGLSGRLGKEHPLSKTVFCINNNMQYGSVAEAGRELGLCKENIAAVCRGIASHHKNYIFRYI